MCFFSGKYSYLYCPVSTLKAKLLLVRALRKLDYHQLAGWCPQLHQYNQLSQDGVAVFCCTISGAKKNKDPLVTNCGVRVKKTQKATGAVARCASAARRSLPGALLLCSSAKFVS